MSYPQFLIQWYNWPYLAGFGLAITALLLRGPVATTGVWLGRRLGFDGVPGYWILVISGLSLGVVGLTFNGTVHDYRPGLESAAFLPVLFLSLLFSLLITRSVGRIKERQFPEFKSVRFGTPDLAGCEGRVVSRVVSPDYKAGRAQVMDEEKTLHVIMCKTRTEEIPFASAIKLLEYDEADGRYYVEVAGKGDDAATAG